MKVVMVGSYPEPGKQVSGGVERVIDALLPELAGQVDLTLIVTGASRNEESVNHGVKTIYLKRGPGPGVARYWTIDARNLARTVEHLNPDLVHFHCGSGLSRFIKQPRLVTVHGILERDIFETNRGYYLRQLAARIIGLGISHIERLYRGKIGSAIVISPYMRKALPDLELLENFDIQNPVSREFIQLKSNLNARECNLVAIQRIGPLKNTLGLLKAAAISLKRNPQARLTICGSAGDENYYKLCRQFVCDADLEDRIVFAGHCSTNEIIKLLDHASCYVTMTNQETAPMAVAEALCRGAAVLGPDDFGFSHMIQQGQNGFLWPTLEPHAQADLMCQALDYAWDREAIAREARLTYDPKHVADRTLAAYRQILDASHRQDRNTAA